MTDSVTSGVGLGCAVAPAVIDERNAMGATAEAGITPPPVTPRVWTLECDHSDGTNHSQLVLATEPEMTALLGELSACDDEAWYVHQPGPEPVSLLDWMIDFGPWWEDEVASAYQRIEAAAAKMTSSSVRARPSSRPKRS